MRIKMKSILILGIWIVLVLCAAIKGGTVSYAESTDTEFNDASLYQDIPQLILNTTETIDKESYKNAVIRIVDPQGKSSMDETSVSIKTRGNSTSVLDKKPYNIKFNSKTSILGLDAGKKYCLLANRLDKSLMRNYLAYSLASQLCLEYNVGFQYVDVWLNGVYQGNYLLTTPVEVGKNRLNIDTENGDCLLEREDWKWEADTVYIYSPVYKVRFAFNEPEKLSAEELSNFTQQLQDAENAIQSGNITQIRQYIDMDSFIDFYILQEYFKNTDIDYSSTRYYIKDKKLYAGPAWDFDLSSGNAGSRYSSDLPLPSGVYALNTIWIQKLLENEEFNHMFRYRYKELQPRLTALYNIKIEELLNTYGDAFRRDSEVAGWRFVPLGLLERKPDPTHGENVEFLRNWLKERNTWLYDYLECDTALDYSAYYEAVWKVEDFEKNDKFDYSAIEAFMNLDVYGDDVTQEVIDEITENIVREYRYLATLAQAAGTPYDVVRDDDETYTLIYDVNIPHVLVNQVYGCKKKGYASHSFIELYNPTSEDIDLSGWSLRYCSSEDGGVTAWRQMDFSVGDNIKAHSSYLVRCNEVESPEDSAVLIDAYDKEWNQEIHNKGVSVALVSNQDTWEEDTKSIYDNENKRPLVEGYVDLLAVSGNDKTEQEYALSYETESSMEQSPKKSLRRMNTFENGYVVPVDTDNNSVENGDCVIVDYSINNAAYHSWAAPRSSADGAWQTANTCPSYTVTYQYGYNGKSQEATYYYGTSPKPVSLKREGYTLENWFCGDEVYSFDNKPDNDVLVYAKWMADKYSITYELSGGNLLEERAVSYTVEDEDLILPAAERIGYAFDGWYDSEDHATQIKKIVKGSMGDIILYAKWKIDVYNVYLHQSVFDEGDCIKAEYGTFVDSAELEKYMPSRDGYLFTGWFENPACTQKFDITMRIKANLHLYAGWKAVPYQITYNLDGGINSDENPSSYTIDSEEIVFHEPYREGFTFVGWYDSDLFANTKKGISKNSFGDVTVYAKWISNEEIETKPGEEENKPNQDETKLQEDEKQYAGTKNEVTAPPTVVAGSVLTDPVSKASYNVTKNGTEVEYVKPLSNEITVIIPNTVTIDGVLYKVTSVGDDAFKNNPAIVKVKIGNNVKTIGKNAFSGCKKLKSAVIDKNVTAIKEKAFYKCVALAKITIPAKVTKIGKWAFYGCMKLKTATIKTTKLTSGSVGSKAFARMYKKVVVQVPGKQKAAYEKLLKKKGIQAKNATIKKAG